MLTFFRRIRKAVLSEGQNRRPASPYWRYIFYAIGEIALVVIGILIALQINNWNEARKELIFEKEVLSDINKGLKLNVYQLKQGIRSCENAAKSCQIILQFLEGELNYHDSLHLHFAKTIKWFRPTVSNTGNESLKFFGRHLIKNDSIRNSLEIFDVEWFNILHDRQEQYFAGTVSPILSKLFTSLAFPVDRQNRGLMVPFDPSELRKSREYYSIVNTLKSNRGGQAWFYKNWLESMEELSTMIENELD